ncbi:CRISPR-associated primase-polymerase type B [Cecembia calidifontis]|uniref:VirE-like protein n=1 Tax=Cecembia calidifontis TaxID=1187080 RepID=A0A4Q7PAD3_9BACT|nr:CRISPR-associated primase-polymerase type B [Cecembia calidifontis]RZS97135.1 VirE-like protein [Cecembia calidifontis]
MIRLGKHITQTGDQLQDISIEKFHKALINPEGEVASLQRRLQAIRAMDPAQYRRLKTTLPYVVCAQFHPKVRRKENFLYADRFLIDIDHISENGLEIGQLREKLQKDKRVELLFASPSGDGLKVLFKIDPKISDPAYYALFYKAFCIQLNQEYQLGAALDHKTHDVSRCCFVSFDPQAYYNPNAVHLHPEAFVAKDSLFEMEQIEKKAKEIEKQHREVIKELPRDEKTNTGQDIPDGVLAFIKEKTGQKLKKPTEKHYEQPEELEWVMDKLHNYLKEINAEIEEVKPIAYGRQVKIRSGTIWAEVNVFFGKRGVSVVGTTKTGSHKEFGKTLTEFLKASFQS